MSKIFYHNKTKNKRIIFLLLVTIIYVKIAIMYSNYIERSIKINMETDTTNVVANAADSAGTVAVNSVNTAVFVLAVVLIIVSIVLCIIILLQSKRSAGLGAVSAVSSADTYWSRNKGNSMEGALERYTKIGGALFMIIAFIINLLS